MYTLTAAETSFVDKPLLILHYYDTADTCHQLLCLQFTMYLHESRDYLLYAYILYITEASKNTHRSEGYLLHSSLIVYFHKSLLRKTLLYTLVCYMIKQNSTKQN